MHNQTHPGNTPNVATLFRKDQNVSRHFNHAHAARPLPANYREEV